MFDLLTQFHPHTKTKFHYSFSISGSKPECKAKLCNQVGTYENILANYCQADFGENHTSPFLSELVDLIDPNECMLEAEVKKS